jgi:tetratricopeptide (TPR) repeat protein
VNCPSLVVATVRSGDRAAAPELLDDFISLAGEMIRLAPLGAGAAARVVRSRLGAATDRFCRACHQATDGNPLLLEAVVGSFVADGAEPGDEAAARVTEYGTESVARLLARRLAVLPTGAGAFIRALAVLGDGSPLRHVAALAELDLEHAAQLADSLRTASVLAASVELAFAHPIIRAAAGETMGTAERGLAHARAAALLAEEGAAADRLALHLLHAHPCGDSEVATTMRAAAAIAVSRGAPETAATYLRRALDEPPPRASRAGVLLELGLAELATRRHPGAVAQLREAVAMIDTPSERMSAALLAGRALGVAGYFQEAAAVLESVPDPDPRIVAELAANGCQLAARVPRALNALARWSDSKPPACPGWQLMQVMLAYRSPVAGDPCPVVGDLLDRGLAGSELFSEQSLVAVIAAMMLVLIDRLDDADRLCTIFIDEGRRRGAPSIVTTFAFPRAFASLRRGLPRDAEADAREAFQAKLQMVAKSESGPTWPLAFLVEARTELGDFTGADEALARVDGLDGELPQTLAWAFVLEARGRLRVAQGRLRDGLRDLREAAERWERLDCDRATRARTSHPAAALARRSNPCGRRRCPAGRRHPAPARCGRAAQRDPGSTRTRPSSRRARSGTSSRSSPRRGPRPSPTGARDRPPRRRDPARNPCPRGAPCRWWAPSQARLYGSRRADRERASRRTPRRRGTHKP